MKRFLALALSLLMILGVLLMAGCNPDTSKNTTTGSNKPQNTTSGTTDGTEDTTGGETDPVDPTGKEKLKGYEDVTFGGDTFVIVGDDGEDDGYNTAKEIYSEESDAISVAVRERNMWIETLYDCKIEPKIVANTGEAISADINGNQHTIDLYVNKYILASIATGGNAYNLLTAGSREIDFTQPWWDQKYVNTYTIKNSSGAKVLYAAIGDFALNSFDCTHSLVFNKTVFRNSESKFQAAGLDTDIYQLVRDHKWTVDVFAQMVKLAASDANGDQTYDSQNGDVAGWIRTIHGTHGLHTASGLAIVKNTDGVLSFEVDDNTESWVKVIDKAVELWSMPQGQTISYSKIPETLAGDRALFSSELLGSSLPNLKDYENLEIGLLPYPVYKEGDEYAHYVDNHVSCYSIPSSCDHPDTVADFLTVYAYSSKYIVRPAYMDVYAYEYCADEDSYEMLNIILDTMTYDIGYLSTSPNLEGEISDMINNGKNQIAQFAGKRVNTANEWITSFISQIDDNKI